MWLDVRPATMLMAQAFVIAVMGSARLVQANISVSLVKQGMPTVDTAIVRVRLAHLPPKAPGNASHANPHVLSVPTIQLTARNVNSTCSPIVVHAPVPAPKELGLQVRYANLANSLA